MLILPREKGVSQEMREDTSKTVINTVDQGRNTEINRVDGSNHTQINQANQQRTEVNPQGRQGTEVNSIGRSPQRSAATDSAALLEEGQVIDGFTVLKRTSLGGGEAFIYGCIDADRHPYVLRVMRKEVTDENFAQFEALIKALNQIPGGVVHSLSYGTIEIRGVERMYEVIPLYRRGSVGAWLKKGKRFTEDEIRKSFLPQILDVFDAIHSANITHRDIKPENIMIDDQGGYVLIDFGIAVADKNRHMTTTDAGTLDYESLFVQRGIVDPAADYYALGITMYEMMTGSTPFAGKTRDVVLKEKQLHHIDRPKEMSETFYKMIMAVTTSEDMANQIKPWGSRELRKWLRGEEVAYPAERPAPIPVQLEPGDYAMQEVNIRFGTKAYRTMGELVRAMGTDWQRAKSFIGQKTDASPLLQALARQALNQSNQSSIGRLTDDIRSFLENLSVLGVPDYEKLFRTIYRYAGGTKLLYWQGVTYESLDQFGRAICLSNRPENFRPLLTTELFPLYLQQHPDLDEEEKAALISNVKGYCEMEEKYDFQSLLCYRIGYSLCDSPEYPCPLTGDSVHSVAELKEYLTRAGRKVESGELSLGQFGRICGQFCDASGKPDTLFWAWLNSQGCFEFD